MPAHPMKRHDICSVAHRLTVVAPSFGNDDREPLPVALAGISRHDTAKTAVHLLVLLHTMGVTLAEERDSPGYTYYFEPGHDVEFI